MTRESEEHWIVLFDSIHHVIAAEDAFKENGLWCDLTPVPRNLSSNCGMAVEFRRCDVEAVRSVLTDPDVRPCRIHRPDRVGYTDVTAVVLGTRITAADTKHDI